MGKIMVALAVLLAVPAVVSAQDFGTEWLDRVTHERQQERGPLKPHPVEWTASTGLLGYIDNNVFLADKTGKTPGDTVIVPFGRARLDYTEQRFEASADLLVNYKGYLDTNHDASVDFNQARDWEERFYGHARYLDARWQLGVEEILRHESDPVDAVFLTRAKRTVSDTVGQGVYDITKVIALESGIDYQVVRFSEKPLSTASDNDNYRADVALVYRQANGFDWLVQAGWMSIFYHHSQGGGSPPDADGYYVRGGWRGELMQRLSVEALAGWIHVSSDRYINTPDHSELSTADISLHARFEVTETCRVYGDLARTVGFAGGDGSPFQTITRFALIGEWEAIENLTLRARIQWDHAATILGIVTEYRSYGLSAAYKFTDYLSADAGVTYRTGVTHGKVASSVEFDDTIFHLGVVLTY
jgi:hypothetical protein